MVEPERPQVTRRMRFACWVSKATHAHKHIILDLLSDSDVSRSVTLCTMDSVVLANNCTEYEARKTLFVHP
jgi:hypothetical protein